MTTYRLFPSTSGPATPISYSGNFISGLNFAANGGGAWFGGYWWWVAASGQSTAPVKCALWAVGGSGTGQVVPGSVVTSGTLTAGQWNFIPVPTPFQLAPGHDATFSTNGGSYIAAIGVNGNFPDTTGFWDSGGPGGNGLWGNGLTGSPLFAYSSNDAGSTAPAPYSYPQGCFTTAGTDPSVTLPLNASGGDNFWVDVQVSDTAPAGYSGSYRLWPNKFDANNDTNGDSAVAYNLGTEIDVSQTITLNAIHYYVPPNASAAAGLATSADVWSIASQTKVAGITSPPWTTETGGATPALGTNPGFWAKAVFPGGVTLPPGLYRVTVYNSNGAAGSWASKDAGTSYFVQGVAANGIDWGVMKAPNMASAQTGDFYPGSGTGTTPAQPVFAYDGLDSFPHFTTGNNPGQVYWVDLEATPVGSANVAGATAGVIVAGLAGTAHAQSPGTLVDASAAMSFRAYTSVTVQATMVFEAGRPMQDEVATLAIEPWVSMYPG